MSSQYSAYSSSSYQPHYPEYGAAQWELAAGEPITPRRKRGWAKLIRRTLLLTVVAAGGWGYYEDWASVPPWLKRGAADAYSAAYAFGEPYARAAFKQIAGPTREDQAATQAASTLDSLKQLAMAEAEQRRAPPLPPPALPKDTPPAVVAPQPPAALTTGSIAAAPASAAGASTAPETHAPKAYTAAAPINDTYQKRAEAAGLHPDISRVLLERLSQTDYKNAATAISAALTQTPDNGTYVWPRQRKPEQAIFEVRFVPGAPPECRRYVVTILKDRWATTALPMERCGAQARGPQKQAAVAR